MAKILARRKTSFVLWCPKPQTIKPRLIIGTIKNGNPPEFKPLREDGFEFNESGIEGLWQLAATECELSDKTVYHYWIEVDGLQPVTRIQVTDPLAYCVDYRLCAPRNATLQHPASVIGWFDGELVACDPNGERAIPIIAPFEKMASNNRTVIYELPTAWVKTSGSNEFERAVGTFRDIRAMIEKNVSGANFPDLEVTGENNRYLVELGINAIEMLPPADSVYSREWGYGTSHFLAPDYELGYPEGNLSPTSNQDLTLLINACHQNGIRIILDVVMGFMKDEPYREIDLDDFYLEDPEKHKGDPDAYSSRKGGGKELRSSFGASTPRYVRTIDTYDPVSDIKSKISPARQLMFTFLSRWMNDFQVDGIRMDSVETVANWDFIRDFKNDAHKQFRKRYNLPEHGPNANFIVVGEELEMPMELLTDNRLDGLWNEKFQGYLRAAIVGQNAADEPSFEWTVRRAIDSGLLGFSDGAKAINYITSHDVQGFRKERLYNQLKGAITVANSSFLFNRDEIEEEVKTEMRKEGREFGNNNFDEQVFERTNAKIVHRAIIRRIKLAFACLLTSVGIPMILAGEEFGDEHDLFDAQGNISQQGGKQVDPVNYSRLGDADRSKLCEYVSRLIKLRTSHPALGVNETEFIHVDFQQGKRVLVWKRGTDNPVVVVANFSDYTTPNALGNNAEYFVPNWPQTPAGNHWCELTRKRNITDHSPDREPIFAWEAKIFYLEAN